MILSSIIRKVKLVVLLYGFDSISCFSLSLCLAWHFFFGLGFNLLETYSDGVFNIVGYFNAVICVRRIGRSF